MKISIATAVLCSVFLCACTGSIKLLENGKSHSGTYNSMSKEVSVVIDDKLYQGKYTEHVGFGFGQSVGLKDNVSTATAIASSGNGAAVLTSADGKVIECSFTAGLVSGQGRCESLDGRRFVLVIEN